MSKMNNNSRKNSKTSKNAMKKATRSRKSSKKNFKIESLEPRLMMDASAGYDIDKIDECANQFDTITVSTEENSLSSLGSFTEFGASDIETSEIVNRPMALLRALAAESLSNNVDAPADSDSSSLKNTLHLTDSFEIPYVGATLKIGNYDYKVTEIIDIVDQVRLNLLNAMQGNVSDVGDSIQLNLPAIKAKFDSLTDNISSLLNGGTISDFLSAIYVSESINILDSFDGASCVNIDSDCLAIDFCLNSQRQRVDFSYVEFDTEINTTISIDVEICRNGSNILGENHFKSFKIEMPGITAENTKEYDLPICVENGHLQIVVTENQVTSNVKLDDFIDFYYDSMNYDVKILDDINVPFLDELVFSKGGVEFNIKEILDVVDAYNRITQFVVDYSICDDGSIDLSGVSEYLNKLSVNLPLRSIGINVLSGEEYDDSNFVNILDASSVSSDLHLNDGNNTILFKISPVQLEYTKCIDLGLVSFSKFGVDFDAYLKFDLYRTKSGDIVLLESSLDKIGVELYAGIDELNLGVFKVGFGDCGKLSFKVSIDPKVDDISKLISDKKIQLECDGLDVNGFKISDQKETLIYNIDSGEWTLPDSLKRFASFSNDNLITQVHTVLNTTQSALRNLVESKTKLDFLDGSIEKVLDVVDKVEKVVYGDGKNEEYGLYKRVNEQFEANFDDVVSFVDNFNKSWKFFVNKNEDIKDDLGKIIIPCKMEYLDEEGNAIPKNDEGKPIDENSEFKSVQLSFELRFGCEHDFGLNFAKTLENYLMNVSSCGYVHVNADASITFNLIIDFDSKVKLDSQTKLDDDGIGLKNPEYQKDEYYVTYDFNSPRQFDEDLYIKLVKCDENDKNKGKLAVFTVNKDQPLGNTNWSSVKSAGADAEINYLPSSKKIYITASELFDVENGDSISTKTTSGGDAFAELKLTGTSLQTVCKTDVSTDEWVFSFVDSKNADGDGKIGAILNADASITISYSKIQELVGNGIIFENSDKKKQINEYLDLQKDDDNIAGLPSELKKGWSIMNTYGLYVLDVDGNTIIFACDSRKIKSGSGVSNYLMYGEDGASSLKYMRVSGEIPASAVKQTKNLKGVFVYKVDSNKYDKEHSLYGENVLKDVTFVQWDFAQQYDKDKIENAKTALEQQLGSCGVYIVESEINVGTEKKWVLSLKSNSKDVIVKNSESVLKIEIDNTPFFVNTSDCINVSSLANAIGATIKASSKNTDVFSVSVVNGDIVFTTNGVDIKIYEGSGSPNNLSKENNDFKIDKGTPVEFQACLKASSTIGELCIEINKSFEKDGFRIELVKEDHLEIVAISDVTKNKPFILNGVGTSKALEWLGFTRGQTARLVGGDYKIVGASLVGFDWTKAIHFDGVKLEAKLGLSMDTKVDIKSVGSVNNDRVTLYINESDENVYNADGFLRIGSGDSAEYYRIEKVNVIENSGKIKIESIEVSTISLKNHVMDGEIAKKFETWNQAVYAASVSASLGFLGADVIAEGSASFTSSFELIRPTDSETADIFGFKVGKVELNPGKGSNSFTLTGYSDIFDDRVEIASGSISIDNTDCFKLESEFNFKSEAYGDLIKSFSNFSIEKLFAVLESLIDRIDSITKDTDYIKIPVINKSVRDLVNVATDLRDIVKKLRAEKETSLQKFGNLLNNYLENLNLNLYDKDYKSKKLFEFVPVYKDVDGKKVFDYLEFNFNIRKEFDTSHRFSFGSGSSGVHGDYALKVTGGLGFTLSARVDFSDGFDLVLEDAIKFGADIAIAGDKMHFDLGINAGGNNSLLRNLISVGFDNNDAFVYGKARFEGLLTGKNIFDAKDNSFNLSYSLPVAVFGKLPVYACDMALGDVYIGKFVNGNVAFIDKLTYENVVDAVNTAIDNYASDKTLLYVVECEPNAGQQSSTNMPFSFGLKTTDDSTPNDGDLIVDFSEVYKKIEDLANFDNLDWFTQIKLAVVGLNNLFETLESNMNSNMGSKVKSVPVLGSALSSGVDFLSVLRDKVLDPLSKFLYGSTGLNAEMIAKKMDSLLDGYFLETQNEDGDNYKFEWSDKKDWKRSADSSGKGTWFRTGNETGKEYAEWFFNLGQIYDYGKSIDFDLGFPGLGLSSNVGLNLSLSWALEFGFGISRDKGFYFIFGNGDEISVRAIASLDGEIMGSLAGLGMSLNTVRDDKHPNRQADIQLFLGVDLNKNSTIAGEKVIAKAESSKKKWTLKNTNQPNDSSYAYENVTLSNAFTTPSFEFDAKVDIDAGITVGVVKEVDRNTPKFPNIVGDFEFEWDYNVTAKGKTSLNKLGFYRLELDMGSFIGGVLGPIVSKIQKVIEPIEPLINFLKTPFPVLDDLGIRMTPLDLAKKYSKGKFDDSMINAISDLIALSKTISAISASNSGFSIALGDFELIKKKGGVDTNGDAEKFLKGETSISEFAGNDDETENKEKLKAFASELENGNIGENASSLMSSKGLNTESSGNWEFIWNNPSKIFQLLLGKDVDLVKYTMPKLCFDFEWSTFVRIWGPLGARLGVSLSATIQLGFGYDTLGIRQWVKSDYKDYGRLLNGFYVADKDNQGTDVNELSFYGGLTASAELNAGISAGVGGGVGINVGFNLYDPNQDGKVRLSEMKQIISEDGLFGMFDVNGAITAKLYAYVDLFLFSKKWNITGDITLFKFDYKHSTIPVMASKNEKGDVIGHVGPSAGDRISTNKDNPTLNDGDENITLELSDNKVSWGKKSVNIDGKEGEKLIIDGGAGTDKIKLSGEANFDIEIKGGDGDDDIDLSGLTVKEGYAVIIWGGAGNDTIKGAKGLNIIFGDTGVARIDEERDDNEDPDKVVIHKRKFVVEGNVDAGVAGDDTIIGNSGTAANAVNRNIIIGGVGNDKIYGGIGNDIIFGDGGKIEFDLLKDADKNAKQKDYKERATGNELKSIAGVGADEKTVKVSRTDISADGGDDVILGGSGGDSIYGGSGNDHIDGGAGKDVIFGERGNDRILGGSGDDKIYGGSGHDILFGDCIAYNDKKQNDDIFDIYKTFKEKAFSEEFKSALASNDIKKSDFAISEVENVDVDKNDEYGSDKIYGGEGDDLIFGDSGAADGASDIIEGGIGNDVIDGDGGNDTIDGGIDNDVIYGGAGDDVIDGGAGNDSLYGDAGVLAYKSGYKNYFGGDQITFGENTGLLDHIYKDFELNSAESGNDKIYTGPGMDFVDGQGGDDHIIVSLMGGSETGYANVIDSDGNLNNDTLTIEATEYNDTLLMRMSEDQELGFVALLPQKKSSEPEGSFINENIERVNFTKGIGVVNLNANGGDDKIYVDGTAKITNIDGGAGDDEFQIGQLYNSERIAGTQSIAVDDGFNTIKTTKEKYLSDGVTENTTLNVEGGVGNDKFTSLHNVGSLNMAGGIGNDAFAVYNYETEIVDAEGKHVKDTPIVGGAISVDGGSGDDTLSVSGTEGDDTVVVTKEGTLSNSVGIKALGVESSSFSAAGGDDIFYVISNKKGETTEINGGHGNDTVSIGGGLDENATLRSADADGQKNTLKYEVLKEKDLDKDQKDVYDTSFESKSLSITENYTVLDTSNEPVVVIATAYEVEEQIATFGTQNQPQTTKKTKFSIGKPEIEIVEGLVANVEETPHFYVACSGDLKDGTVNVKLTAPMLSTSALQSGEGEILIGILKTDTEGNDYIDYEKEIEVSLTKDSEPVAIYVMAVKDKLVKEESIKSIMVNSEWSFDNRALKRSVSAVSVKIKDSVNADVNSNEFKTARNKELNKLLTKSDEFVISGDSVELGEIPVDSAKLHDSNVVSVYIQGYQQFLTFGTDYEINTDMENGVHTLKLLNDSLVKEFDGKTLVVNYRTNEMNISGSKLRLAYENVDSTADGEQNEQHQQCLKSVVYTVKDENGTIVSSKLVLTKKELENKEIEWNARYSDVTEPSEIPEKDYETSVYYALYGNSLVFFNSINNQLMTLCGTVTISATGWIKENAGISAPEAKNDYTDGFLNFEEETENRSHILAELPENVAVNADSDKMWYSSKFKVSFDNAKYSIADGKHVYVKISVADIIAKMEDSVKTKNLIINAYTVDGKIVDNKTDGSVILDFTNAGEVYTIVVSASHDSAEEDYGIVSIEANSSNAGKTIKDVEGSVLAFGEGTGMNADFDNPEILSYQHKFSKLTASNGGVGKKEVVNANEYNEKNNYDTAKLSDIVSIDGNTIVIPKDAKFLAKVVEHNTVKVVKDKVTTEWLRIEKVTSNDKENTFTLTLNESVTGFVAEQSHLMFSGPKDYLFTPEADNTDRIFVNNQDASANAKTTLEKVFNEQDEVLDSVKFTNKDLTVPETDRWQGAIVANHFEFGEYNLGSGEDKVDIYKTHYRNDDEASFQTFTVVNTGDGEDQIKVHSYKEGSDGQLVINAEDGGEDKEGCGDKIDATSEDITKNGMIVFGGKGRDTIDVNQGVIAFGDMGNIQYKNAKGEIVTNLGYKEVDSGDDKKYETIHTKISKDDKGKLEKQTDGVARGATSIKSVGFDVGAHDKITAGGHDSIVVGGFAGDEISVTGGKNVVLGDNGEIKYTTNETVNTTWHNNKDLHKYLASAATIADDIGDKDTIKITGDNNVAMGGDKSDTITIGVAGQQNSGCNNVVLGDGGIALFTKAESADDPEKVTPYNVHTTHDAIGDIDTIKIYGGGNVAMGGAKNDKIYIGEAGYNSDNNVVLGDGGIYDLKKDVSLDISTTSDEIGDRDTIEIHGGKNAVMGGFKNDDIDIFGNDNVVLGDGGSANYDKRPEVVKGDTNVNAGLIKVETSADEIKVEYPDFRNPDDEGKRLNDEIDIHGDINIVMGGVDDDKIIIDGANNVVVGDAGVYTVRENSLTVETKSEPFGGQDYIQTGDGQNTILGGTDVDTILTGRGNDIIVGDGGLVIMDKPEGNYRGHNPLIVTNSGKNVAEEDKETKSAGGDFIHAGDGNNVIFGGLGDDKIDSGNGEDVVFGDNGYATFRGNAGLANDLHEKFTDLKDVFTFENAPEVRDSATLSFNFQGTAQQGINADEFAGADEFRNKQWNNISGSLAGTYGNDDREIVRFDDGSRASSVSVTYAGREEHRRTSTDNSINAQNYNHWFWNNSADNKLMTSGIMTTSHNNQKQNVMEVTVDGLKQHFDSYQVAVYMDIPDAHSWENQSVRLVSLYIDGVRVQAFYINDPAGANFTGEFKNRSVKAVLDGNGDVVGVEVLDEDGQTVIKPMDDAMGRELAWSNYVVFDVGAEIASDRIVIVIEDGIKEWNMNGKDLPGIAGLQVKGQLHKQDIAASTDVKFGGDDEIMTRGGDDIVVGGTGSDTILTHGGDYYIDNGEIKESSADHIIQQDTDIDEYVKDHTTFDDERLGIYDNDVVFGDNAKMLFTERDGDLNTASTLTTAESVTISKDEISHSETDKELGEERQNKDKYKDYIYTGDGNDVVVGGIGGDEIKAGATPAADQMMDGINVFSVNFTVEHSDATNSIASGESAGVVVDNQWHEFYRNNRGVMVAGENVGGNVKDSPKYNQDMDFLSNHPTAANEYAVVDGVEVRMYGIIDGNVRGASSFTLENYNELDGDTSNSKLFNAYIAGQQNEEIVLNLIGLDKIAKQENNKVDESYDLYIYLGGDNNDKDTWEHLYEIKLTDENGNTQYRYLNDWTGHKFDGDYREAYCDDMQDALEALSDFTTPRVEIIGNYVVFHGVTGNIADIRIKNILSNGGQNPKNLPMITALQIVSGNGRYKESENGSLEFKGKHYELADIAVGGDHDKDLVYGDEAKLWFDLDIPYAADENIADYKNRVIEAKSIAVDNEVAKAVSTDDKIFTGKDRDVAVGGEGSDKFTMGDGDDIALGGNANLIVEHNNPVGVFTPNTEIVLDQHSINTNIHQDYLDNDNSQVQQFQDRLNQHRIQGIDTNVSNSNDRYDTFDMGTGRDLTYQDSWSEEQLVVPQLEENQNNTNNQGNTNQGENNTGNNQGNTNQGENNQGTSNNTNTDVRVESIGTLSQIIVFEAGKTIKLVCSDYPQGNPYWTPNICIRGNNSGPNQIPELEWSWDGKTQAHTNTCTDFRVDIPDHPNGENGMYEIYVTAKTSGEALLYVDQ